MVGLQLSWAAWYNTWLLIALMLKRVICCVFWSPWLTNVVFLGAVLLWQAPCKDVLHVNMTNDNLTMQAYSASIPLTKLEP